MGIYNTFDWGDGTLYGDASKVGYSAEPLTATAIGSTIFEENVVIDIAANGQPIYGVMEAIRPRVDLSWTNPTGSIFGFRIVRNQDGWSENEEDGKIILETFVPVVPDVTNFTDQFSDVPLVEGRYAYYTVWLLLADYSWAVGAYTYCLVPTQHSVKSPDGTLYKTSERKFLDLIPKVYTSEMQSYLDEVSETSDLRIFLGGFSYTLDETLTFADLLIPDISGKSTNPNTVALQAEQLGLPKQPTLSIQRKKALIRNSVLLNKNRGSIGGVSLLAKSITGFGVDAAVSPNLLLNIQDSSFYKTVGHWTISANGTLTSNLTTGTVDLPDQNEVFSVDRSYTGKAITSASNVYMSLGNSNPTLEGIPVTAENSYYFSFYFKGTAANVTPSVTWYNRLGAVISTTAVTASAASSTWAKKATAVTAPVGAYFAGITLTFASAGTYYIDMIQFAEDLDDVQTYYREARGVDVRLLPSKMNYINNPSMVDNGGTDWAWTGIATSSWTNNSTLPGIKLDNTKMLRLTTNATSSPFTVTTETDLVSVTGVYYTFSIYLSTVSGTQELTVKLEAFDEDDELIVSESGLEASFETATQTIGTTWVRVEVPVFVPSQGSAEAYFKATISGTASGAALNLDAAQIEQGYGASDYFDGSYTNRGASWSGTANASASILYRTKSPKIDRLINELPDFIPLNTGYTITSGINGDIVLETSGLSS